MVHSAASGSAPTCDDGKTEAGRHTPGPWEYYPANNYAGFAIAPSGTLPTLAAVERPRGNPQTLNVTAFNFPGQTEANARLIAAAPELLAAAIKSHGPYEGLSDQDVIDLYGGREAELCFALRAAIAKALGTEA